MFSRRIALVACVARCHPFVGAAAAERMTLRFATGSKTGVYYPIGCGIKRVIEDAYPNDVQIEVVETSGALENLRLIDRDEVDLALVQNEHGLLLEPWAGDVQSAVEQSPGNRLPVHGDYPDHCLEEERHRASGPVEGQRVRTGAPPETSTSNSATVIFSLDGWEASGSHGCPVRFRRSPVFAVVELPGRRLRHRGNSTPLLTEKIDGISLQDYVTLLPINEGLANRLMRAFPYFVYTEVPAHTYSTQEKPVKTVGVRAILIVRKTLRRRRSRVEPPTHCIRTLTRLIFEKEETIRTAHGVASANLSKYRFSLDEALSESWIIG